MNVKLKLLIMLTMLSIIFPLSYSYELVSFNADSEVPYGLDGGFTMQVRTTSGNLTLEPLDDLDVHVDVLYNGIPLFTYCKYQDGNECYLWKTDQNGKVNGLFYIHSSYLVGEPYTLEVTIGNVTQQQIFTVANPVTDPSSWGPIYWVEYNLGPFLVIIIILILLCLMLYHFFR